MERLGPPATLANTMAKKLPLILLALASCGRGDSPRNQTTSAASEAEAPAPAATAGRTAAAPRLAGLYEGGRGGQKDQLCIVEKGARAQFGLVVWGPNLASCSGAGEAIREGDRLRLKMEGDETCTVEAAYKSGTVTLPATVPTGCAYYCGARATLARARFARSGDDPAKATDVAGDSLCG
jgi:hypothetical protein